MRLFNIVTLFLLLGNALSSACQKKEEQKMNEMWGEQVVKLTAQTAKQGQLFRDGNYAMFIHWGLYSNLGNEWKGRTFYGIGEWIMNKNMANIPVDEYKATARSFNPKSFNAREIAQLARDAGMKYIIITSKHHDGFAMYGSNVNKFNIVDATPFGRDPMKELSQACREVGIGFGFYYSHNQDWTEPGGNGGPTTNLAGEKMTFADYFKNKCLPQVQEITTGYGPIELVWFDTPGNMPKEYAQQLVDLVHKNQPHAYVSGRVGHNLGDYVTLGDMEVPIQNEEGLWESVDVTNDSWGYAAYDQNWKSPKEILSRMISTVARGGTYMLNVGPKPDGTIPEQAARSLRSAGEWIRRYPQVVYGTDASPWKHILPWGDVTAKGNKLFLSVYNWPVMGQLFLPGLKTDIVSVNILSGKSKKPVSFKKTGNWVHLNLSGLSPEKLISVIEVTLKGTPEVDTAQGIDPVTENFVPADFATVQGCVKNPRKWMEKFGEWKHVMQINKWSDQAKATWEVEVMKAGTYLIGLTYSGNGRMIWSVETDEGAKIKNQQNSSSIYMDFPIGWINFTKSGKHSLSVSLLEGDFEKANLTGIKISPVEF